MGEPWAPVFPSSQTSSWLIPMLMLVISSGGFLSGWLKVKKCWRTGMTRKIFHFIIFTTAVILSATMGHAGVNLLGVLMGFYVFTLVRVGEGNIFFEGIARESDAPHRALYVLIPFVATGVGGLASSYFFGEYAAVGFVATGWGDAVGEPIGLRFGKHRYKVPALFAASTSERSLEGSTAVFLAAFLGVALVIALAGWSSSTPVLIGVALAAAAATTLVEAVSHHGLDNLTIQVAASASAWALLGSTNA